MGFDPKACDGHERFGQSTNIGDDRHATCAATSTASAEVAVLTSSIAFAAEARVGCDWSRSVIAGEPQLSFELRYTRGHLGKLGLGREVRIPDCGLHALT